VSGPPLHASGRDADVFLLGEGRVLRRYRDGSDASDEAALMRYVAGHGYPAPAVLRVDGPDLEMELLDGPTMMHAVRSGDLDAAQAARMLADLHDRLHRLPGRHDRTEGIRVVHRDLHPENVLLVARGPVVIDWRNAGDGEPAVDVALSALILAQVAVDDADVRSATARAMLGAFAAAVGDDPVRRLDDAVAIRAADAKTTVDERARLATAASLVRTRR
jgi:Ser/Thr protein kinase RdoA (MazF antagonist)